MKTLSLSTLTLKILLTAALSLGSFFSVSQPIEKPDDAVDYLAKGYSPIKFVGSFKSVGWHPFVLDMLADGRFLQIAGLDGNKYAVYNKAGEKLAHYQHNAFHKAYKGKLFPDNSVVVAHAKGREVHIVHFMPDGITRTFEVKVPIRIGDDHRFTFSDDKKHLIIPNDKEILIIDVLQQSIVKLIPHNVTDLPIKSITRNDADGYFRIKTPKHNEQILSPEGAIISVNLDKLLWNRTQLYPFWDYGFNTALAYRFTSKPARFEANTFNYVSNSAETLLVIDGITSGTTPKTRTIPKFTEDFLYFITPRSIRVYELKSQRFIAHKSIEGFGTLRKKHNDLSIIYYPDSNLLRIKNRRTSQYFDFIMPAKIIN